MTGYKPVNAKNFSKDLSKVNRGAMLVVIARFYSMRIGWKLLWRRDL